MAGCCCGRELQLFDRVVQLSVPSGRLDTVLYDYVRTHHSTLDLSWIKCVSCSHFDINKFDPLPCIESTKARPGDVILLYAVVRLRLTVVAMITTGRQCTPSVRSIGFSMSDVPLQLCRKQVEPTERLSFHPTLSRLRDFVIRTRPSFLCSKCFNTLDSFDEYCEDCFTLCMQNIRVSNLSRDADTLVALRTYVLSLRPNTVYAAAWAAQLSYVCSYSSAGLLRGSYARIKDGHGIVEVSELMASMVRDWPELVLGQFSPHGLSVDAMKRVWAASARAILFVDAPLDVTYCGLMPWHIKKPEGVTSPPGFDVFYDSYKKFEKSVGVTAARAVFTLCSEPHTDEGAPTKRRRLTQSSLGQYVSASDDIFDIEDLLSANAPPCIKPLLQMKASHMDNSKRFPLASFLAGTHLSGEKVQELWKQYVPDQTAFIIPYIYSGVNLLPPNERRRCAGCLHKDIRGLCHYKHTKDPKAACQSEMTAHTKGRLFFINSPADYFERRVFFERSQQEK